MHDQLPEFLSSLLKELSLREIFCQVLEEQTIEAHHHVIEYRQASNHFFFMVAGLAVQYQLDEVGRRLIDRFWAVGDMVYSMESFFDGAVSNHGVVFAEDGQVLRIAFEEVRRLMEVPATQEVFCKFFRQQLEADRRRLHEMRYTSKAKQLERLMRRYPRLGTIVPQEYIASYLGITPQSLSRIKRRASKQK